jgi:hypothetical protein
MRYSKRALLIFGAGGLLGLVVVSANLSGLARIASLTMAAGIALLPLAVIADWRRSLSRPKPKANVKAKPKQKQKTAKRRASPARPTRPRTKH